MNDWEKGSQRTRVGNMGQEQSEEGPHERMNRHRVTESKHSKKGVGTDAQQWQECGAGLRSTGQMGLHSVRVKSISGRPGVGVGRRKESSGSEVWWHMPIVTATWVAETTGPLNLRIHHRPEQCSKTTSQTNKKKQPSEYKVSEPQGWGPHTGVGKTNLRCAECGRFEQISRLRNRSTEEVHTHRCMHVHTDTHTHTYKEAWSLFTERTWEQQHSIISEHIHITCG